MAHSDSRIIPTEQQNNEIDWIVTLLRVEDSTHPHKDSFLQKLFSKARERNATLSDESCMRLLREAIYDVMYVQQSGRGAHITFADLKSEAYDPDAIYRIIERRLNRLHPDGPGGPTSARSASF